MKTLLISCKKFESKIKKLATRPADINPELINQSAYKTDKSIVLLITVEKEDDLTVCAKKLRDEVEIFSRDTGIKQVVIFPFGHLSNNLASSKDTTNFLDLIEKELKGLKPIRVHFGSHKSLLLDIHGHPGNVRFREF